MGRKPKSKEEKDENRRLRQNRYYQKHKDKINKRNMDYYWRRKEVDKKVP